MKTIRIVPLLLAVLLAFSSPAYSEEVSAEKTAEIEKLLQITGALQLGQQFSMTIVEQLTDTLRATHAQVPEEVLTVLPEEVNAVISENMPLLKDAMVLIYSQHFTLNELKGLNQFYSTEIGSKVISTLPSVMQQSMAAGHEFGQILGPEVARRIQAQFKKEGFVL